jgi:hypothetical protein
VSRNWTYHETAAHTIPQLWAEIKHDRIDRGEPEDGAIATEAEARRWLRKANNGTR